MKIALIRIQEFSTDARIKTYYSYLNSQNHQIDILDSLKMGIKRERNSKFSKFLVKYILFFVRITIHFIKNHDYDVLQFHNTPNFFVFTSIVHKIFKKVKVVLDHLDVFPLVVKVKTGNETYAEIAAIEQRLSVNYADAVLCADLNQKDYLLNSGINKSSITVIHNIANESIFNKKNTKRSDNEFRLIYHGTIAHRLGIDLMLQAVNIARENIPNLKLYLLGMGEFEDEVKSLINSLNISDIVTFDNRFIPVEELPQYISQMDAGIIGNRITPISDYMLPVKLLEYIKMEIPVIAPRSRILSRYFEEDMLCFYTPENIKDMSEKILMLYKDKSKQKVLVANALKFYDSCNYETEMEKYRNVISV